MVDIQLIAAEYVLKNIQHSKRKYLFIPEDLSNKASILNQLPEKMSEPKPVSEPPKVKEEIIDTTLPKAKEKPKEPIPEVKKPTEPEIKQNKIEIKPFKTSSIDEMKDLKELISKKYPKTLLYDVPLNDSKARQIKNAWKQLQDIPPVVIFYSKKHHEKFLFNVSKAISQMICPSIAFHVSNFELKENFERLLNDPKLKLVITPDEVLLGSKVLMSAYKELPQKKLRFLGEKPLLLLPDLSLYFKDPKLKASLWRLICQHLQHN